MNLPIFVVAGTGRCGSTLLSQMLALHPNILSLSEFLVPLLLAGIRQPEQMIHASDFCAALNTCLPTTTALLRAGINIPELAYDFAREGARFTGADGLPFPLFSAIAKLSDDPDRTFEDLQSRILAANGATVRDHLDTMFYALATLSGRTVLVERSGGSLAFTYELRTLLSQARFILLTRNGPDTCRSMQRHPYFRHTALRALFVARLGYDPYVDPRREGTTQLPDLLQRQLPENFTHDGFDALELPLELFASLWSQHTQRGLAALPDMPHHLTYEDLCTTPRLSLQLLAKALGVPAHPHWIEAAERLIAPVGHPHPNRAADDDEAQRLRAACAPGIAALLSKGFHN